DDPNASMVIPEVSGVLVIRVLADTPAANAGLRRGDVITQIDEQRFDTANQLQSYVDQVKIGQRLRLSLRRGDQTQSVTIKAAELNLDA
ncbi:MAG: PDZ domain-containing protein, partial [Cyanobacteria bacterium J06636_28]